MRHHPSMGNFLKERQNRKCPVIGGYGVLVGCGILVALGGDYNESGETAPKANYSCCARSVPSRQIQGLQ